MGVVAVFRQHRIRASEQFLPANAIERDEDQALVGIGGGNWLRKLREKGKREDNPKKEGHWQS
jgi:hypothetical protein